MPDAITPTTVFTNAAGTVRTHPAGYASLRYHAGSWQVADLAAVLTSFGQTLLRHGWHYCLTDAREMPLLSAESKQWLEANWLGNRTTRPQPTYMALVQSGDVFIRLGIAQLQVHNHGSTYYTYFTTEEEAHAWLLAQLNA